MFSTWQDGMLAFVSFVFALALVPAIRATEKPPFSTSVLTCTLLLITSITEATLSLWLGAISALITALCWFILSVQKIGQVLRDYSH